MREIVDRHFPDNWVVPYYLGFTADLTVEWDRYKVCTFLSFFFPFSFSLFLFSFFFSFFFFFPFFIINCLFQLNYVLHFII